MPSEFRPSTPSDAPHLVALAQRLLGVAQGSPMFAARHLHWKYWAPWREASLLARSYVLVRDGQIVAHAGVLPLTCRVRGRELTLLHPFDWMSEPSAIGSGAALLQRLARLGDGLVIVGGSTMTQRMAGPLGFRAVGEVTRYVASAASETPDGAPTGAVCAREDDAGVCVRLTEQPAPQDCESVEPPEPWCRFAHTPERLQDYQSCPATPMAVYTASRPSSPQRENDVRLGGFVLAFAPEQARVVALWTASSSSEDQALIVRLAYHQAVKHPGVTEVVSMTNAPMEQRALAASGFQPAGSVPMFVLARELDADVRLSFQMLDGDVAFLHRGAPDPWL